MPTYLTRLDKKLLLHALERLSMVLGENGCNDLGDDVISMIESDENRDIFFRDFARFRKQTGGCSDEDTDTRAENIADFVLVDYLAWVIRGNHVRE